MPGRRGFGIASPECVCVCVCVCIYTGTASEAQNTEKAAMSDKEVFVAHINKLFSWLRSTCTLDSVDARSDIRVQDYSQKFVIWLMSRFPVGPGLLATTNNTPAMWVRKLTAVCKGLNEMRTEPRGRLLFVDMSDGTALEGPVQHWTYCDVCGV